MPSTPGAPPQAHFSCSRLEWTGAEGCGVGFALACSAVLTCQDLRTPPARRARRSLQPPNPAALRTPHRPPGRSPPRVSKTSGRLPRRTGVSARSLRPRRCGGGRRARSRAAPILRCTVRRCPASHPTPYLRPAQRLLELGVLASGGTQQAPHTHRLFGVRRQKGGVQRDVADVPARHVEAF